MSPVSPTNSLARRAGARVDLVVDTGGTTGAYRLYVSDGMHPAVEHDYYQHEIPKSPAL